MNMARGIAAYGSHKVRKFEATRKSDDIKPDTARSSEKRNPEETTTRKCV